MTTTFTPRVPKGIRRHYNSDEQDILTTSTPQMAGIITGRPDTGITAKSLRIEGIKVDTHFKDGSGKYFSQEETKAQAMRNGHPWMPWEDSYLLRDADKETLREKALSLGRTYRAVESRRRDLLRQLDH